MSRNNGRVFSNASSSGLPPLEEGDNESSSADPSSPNKSLSVVLPQTIPSALSDLPLTDSSPPNSIVKAKSKAKSTQGDRGESISSISIGSSSAGSKPKISFFGFGSRSSSSSISTSSTTPSASLSSHKNPGFRSSFFPSGQRSGSFQSSSNNSILASLNNDGKFQKRSSLARKNKSAMLYQSRMATAQLYRGYSIDDYALVVMNDLNSSSDLESDRTINGNVFLVNKHGYPNGKGKTQPERSGPYSYLLCTIIRAHYEENEVFWTVTREDNGEEMRGDARNMQQISSDEGLVAAQQAALTSRVFAEDNDDNNEDSKKKSRSLGYFSNCLCMTCCLPFLCIYDCLKLAKESSAYKTILKHARMFLNGRQPYNVSFRITSVKVIVVCSIWYLFMDQIRLAFLPPSFDGTLAWINFVVWLILAMELILGVFVRPEEWHSLVRSDKAYTPQTAQYINGVHLFVESISLVFFVPVFFCIFRSETTCSSRLPFSFLEASLAAVLGPSLSSAFYGRFFYGVIRLRVFALVRHWRNAWNHSTFGMNHKKHSVGEKRRTAFLYGTDEMSTSTMDTTEEYEMTDASNRHVVPYGANSYGHNRSHRKNSLVLKEKERKVREESRVKATNIGTALMTVNSHRALFLYCFLTACLPMLFLFNMNAVVDPASEEMVEYLQAINLQDVDNFTGEDSSIDCDYLFDSVDAWSKAMVQFDPKELIPITEDRAKEIETTKKSSIQLISVSIWPPRCSDTFNNKTIGNFVFQVGEDCPPWSWSDEKFSGGCIYGSVYNLSETTGTLEGVATNLSVRVGSINTFKDHSETNPTFAVSATYNHTDVIRFGARNYFVLELLLLIIIIATLLILRSDTVELAFGSLRSMLRIVLRYAKNPLSPPGGNEMGKPRFNSANVSRAYDSIEDGEDDEQLIRTYETEQLVTAVSKITDLLRKCWGVAGADIISTNLASRDGDFEVFNPTVPGRNVFALFAFAAITDFDYALKNLDGDVMILINDVASVLHGEVYRWGLGDSGQCNRNLGSAFFMVFKIGSVMEVVEKLEEATKVVFSTATGKKTGKKIVKRATNNSRGSEDKPTATACVQNLKTAEKDVAMEAMAEAMQLPLEQIPGISTFTDRAVIGMLKSFASIHRDTQLRAWSKDFRLKDPTGDMEKGWSVDMIFGMDAGWAIEGAVGSEYKIDATYLSPHVNMSSRMMSACKQYGVTILLSEAVHELLSEPGKAKMRNLDRVTVKGSSKIQNIYTYDARANGTYLFLNVVSDEQADQQAMNYDPSIWNADMDLKDMRHHITEDFEQEFKAGMKAYYEGDWPTAIETLERANDLMIETAMEEGDLGDSFDSSPEREELYRNETSDPPSMYLINFMKSNGGKAPDDWDGWHPLMSK